MLNDENTDLLLGLGLSPNQAKVYQTILKLGSATVGMIAKSSAVRREDVYRILPALERMGLTEKLLGKPAKIRATPVAGALTSLIVDEKVKSDERIATMKEKFRKLAKVKWTQPVSLGEEESLYALISEGKAILAKTSDLIVNSKKEIFWIENQGEILRSLYNFSKEYLGAIRRDVIVRMIFEDCRPDDLLRKQVQSLINTKSTLVRFHRQLLNRFIVFDSKEALITTDRKSGLTEAPVLWTTDNNLIGVLKGYFENSWKESEELIQNKPLPNDKQ
jgi:sugar-specific transcriptional regulator TrmB